MPTLSPPRTALHRMLRKSGTLSVDLTEVVDEVKASAIKTGDQIHDLGDDLKRHFDGEVANLGADLKKHFNDGASAISADVRKRMDDLERNLKYDIQRALRGQDAKLDDLIKLVKECCDGHGFEQKVQDNVTDPTEPIEPKEQLEQIAQQIGLSTPMHNVRQGKMPEQSIEPPPRAARKDSKKNS